MSRPNPTSVVYTAINGMQESFDPSQYAHCDELVRRPEDGPACRVHLMQGTSFIALHSAGWVRRQVINWREISG